MRARDREYMDVLSDLYDVDRSGFGKLNCQIETQLGTIEGKELNPARFMV
jgi:hypothetical protein